MDVLLNCDLRADADCGAVPELLGAVDMVNLACERADLHHVVADAASRGVRVGAHAGISADGAADFSPRDLSVLMSAQIPALEAVLARAGARLGHVKLGGVLRRLCDERTELAEACVDWMELEREGLPLIVGAGGLLHAVAEARGVPLLREIVAGRVYADEARLVEHGQPGAVIDDPAEATRGIEEWRRTGYLALADGRRWLVEAETIGVSADLPRSAELARAVRRVLGTPEP